MASLIKKLFSKKQTTTEVGTNDQVNWWTEIDHTPDKPIGFGYKCQWFAIKTNDTQAIADLLGLDDCVESNWKCGIKHAYNGFVFITPPVHGWSLIISDAFPDASSEKLEKILDLLSSHFQSVHYYGTHRIVEYHAWVKIEEGAVQRKFAYVGESGEVIWDEGLITEEEKALGFRFEDIAHDDFEEMWLPDEEHVISLAAANLPH